jgi:hypothetical protein
MGLSFDMVTHYGRPICAMLQRSPLTAITLKKLFVLPIGTHFWWPHTVLNLTVVPRSRSNVRTYCLIPLLDNTSRGGHVGRWRMGGGGAGYCGWLIPVHFRLQTFDNQSVEQVIFYLTTLHQVQVVHEWWLHACKQGFGKDKERVFEGGLKSQPLSPAERFVWQNEERNQEEATENMIFGTEHYQPLLDWLSSINTVILISA